MWSYVGCHQKRVKPDTQDAHKRGDQYTYVSLEERSKLVLAWHLGKRDSANTDVERKNGSLRQWCRRLTRLTYAYSKKWEHLHAALVWTLCELLV